MLQLRSDVKAVLAAIKTIKVRFSPNEWEMIRAYYEQYIPLAGPKEPVMHISDTRIDAGTHHIPLRIYRPATGELSALLYFHGGWFSAGNLETHDSPLRQLANRTGRVVIAVDYRLAPEHPFPAGLNDCLASLEWAQRNAESLQINPRTIAVGGDSAGGALAAVCSRKRPTEIAAQVLIYPSTDNRHDTASWHSYRHGPLITRKGGLKAWNWYMPDAAMRNHPDAAPLRGTDFSHMPPTFLAIAEHDPLKDEEIAYSSQLLQAGGEVTRLVYKDMIHGFFQMGHFLKESSLLMDDIAVFLRDSVK